MPLLWDSKAFMYHNTPLVGTDAGLGEILKYSKEHEGEMLNGMPVGWAVVGTHVDDGIGLATSKAVVERCSSAIKGDASVRSPRIKMP